MRYYIISIVLVPMVYHLNIFLKTILEIINFINYVKIQYLLVLSDNDCLITKLTLIFGCFML